MTLALGDALAMTVMRQKGFSRTDFGKLHPGGALGARLKPVSRLMHSGDAVPLTRENSSMHDTIVEMSAKRLGIVGVVDEALTLFEEHRITALFVVEGGKPVGVLHIHDCPASR
jgi:arabinose-5-phosphate isomerase